MDEARHRSAHEKDSGVEGESCRAAEHAKANGAPKSLQVARRFRCSPLNIEVPRATHADNRITHFCNSVEACSALLLKIGPELARTESDHQEPAARGGGQTPDLSEGAHRSHSPDGRLVRRTSTMCRVCYKTSPVMAGQNGRFQHHLLNYQTIETKHAVKISQVGT